MAIGRDLAAKRFFITGATGFLGTALVERILRCVPEAEITRPGPPRPPGHAAARPGPGDHQERLLRPAARRARRRGSPTRSARRVHAVAGDVGQDGLGLDDDGPAALAACDIVIHSAATVSFDAPLDQAVEINLLGPSRVAAAVAAAGPAAAAHLIAVSTAYVAEHPPGRGQGGAAQREPVHPRRRLARPRCGRPPPARRPTGRVPPAGPAGRLHQDGPDEIGAAGDHLLAARAEKLREEWVSDELVDAGTARAHSLGWPDAYPFTKALGERALVESWAGQVPITFVRPSIIESALAEPRPGWIRGFRMAEPIIVSYARGLLREFPGVPEGIIDVIPVDLVVAAILAVAAHGPEPGAARRCTTSPPVCGTPCATADWSSSPGLVPRNPLYDERGQPISVPEWSFPGRGRVQRQLRRADQAMTSPSAAHRAAHPGSRRPSWRPGIEDRHALAKRALGYVELYGAYTETDARYRVDRPARAVGRRSTTTDQRRFCFDPAVIDWAHYVHDVHLPVGHRARPGAHDARAVGGGRAARPGTAGPSFRRTGTWPSSTSSTPSWRRTSSTPMPGWPAGTCRRRAGPASWPTWCARGRRCWPSTGATGATSCAPSTAASRTLRWPGCRRTPGSSSTASC